MLDRLHASRSGEFRRVLRACAIAASRGRQALLLRVPAEQDPDAFLRALHAYSRDRAGRPVRLFTLPADRRAPWTRALGALLGIGDPAAAPEGPATLADLPGTADRLFERLRAAMAADLATDEAASGPGLLFVEGDVACERTLLALMAHLSPAESLWRALPGARGRSDQFVLVAAVGCAPDGAVAARLPDAVETLRVRPLDPEDVRAAPDAAAEILIATLSGGGPGPRPAPAPRRRLGVEEAIGAGLYHDADPGTAEAPWTRVRALAAAGKPADAIVEARAAAGALAPGLLVEAGELALALADSDGVAFFGDAAAAAGEAAGAAWLRAEAALAAADLDAASRLSAEALAAAPSDRVRSAAENTLGKAAFRAGRHDDAERRFDAARDSGSGGREAARAAHNLGLVSIRRGQWSKATGRLQEAVVAADAAGDAFGAALARRNLAIALEHQGRWQPAMEYALQALDRLARLGRTANLPNAMLTVADLLVTFGEWDRALAIVQAAEAIAERTRQAHVMTVCARMRGECRLLRGEAERAIEVLGEAHEAFASRGFADDAAACAARLAEAALAAGRTGEARRWAALAGDSGEAAGRAAVVNGRIALSEGTPAIALAELSRARDLLSAAAQREPLAVATASLADATEALGDGIAAGHLRDEARALIEEAAASVPPEYRRAFRSRPGPADLLEGRPEADAPATGPGEGPRVTALAPRPRLRHVVPKILGESGVLRRVLVTIERVRDVSVPVLLLGESGTGKELFAEALHLMSPRASGPFVRVNAAAFTDTLLLSELFGHERGAFTGAHARKIGRFEAAHGGTLFLDEIGDVSERLQTALLRVIEEQRFQRVGGVETVHVDVRLVFATNRDLGEAMRAGRFREDLFHRISGVTIPVPPLRDRLEDVPALVEQFVADAARETGRTVTIAPDALDLLCGWRWPGNVRELKNVVRKACLLSDGPAVTRDVLLREAPELRRAARRPTAGGLDIFDMVFGRGVSLFDARAEVEVALIREALAQSGGNISAAARVLGMKRPRLSQMVKEYGLKVEAGEPRAAQAGPIRLVPTGDGSRRAGNSGKEGA
ncbi:MAG: sigma 54-interacting transcriptional regulator [Deltaproteobacteria bacterium]|nr:sigma 54-interacting transcriptional regulator [Deltaproteobacteria bacterium]